MDVVIDPGNEQMMDELYVALSKDQNGEGIVSMNGPIGHMPIVFGHKRMLDKVMPTLKQISKQTGKQIRIFKFKKAELLEDINTAN